MDIDRIGEFIKELRLEKGLSQNQLSEELHITRQAISNWENGKAIPDSDVLLLLSSFFNVSINEILSGKRLGKEDNSEEITLQLVDENNKKIRRINKMIKIFSVIITAILLAFLSYYFITNYNSIKVYKIDGKSDDFYIRDGLLIMTKNKSYLQLGEFEQLHEEKEIEKMRLYYVKNGEKKVIIERNDSNFLIKKADSYDEFFIGQDRKYILNSLYIEVTYKDEMCSLLKLRLREVFKNTFKYDNGKNVVVLKDSDTNKTSEQNTINNLLEEEKEKTNLLSEKRIQYEVREENNNNNNNENNNSTYEEQTVVIVDPPAENTKEEEQVSEVINEEEQVPNNENEEQEEINYEEIINLIKAKGTFQFGIYSYEIVDGGKYYMISCQDTTITIEMLEGNVIKEWLYFIEGKSIKYNNYLNYSIDYSDNFLINDTDPKRVDIYNDYINNLEYVVNYMKGN